MNFNLKSPCPRCPFRTDIEPYLRAGRVEEIVDGLLCGKTFSCHQTNGHDGDGEAIETDTSEHCAGALILLEHQGQPNQLMRIAERLGYYDRRALKMDAPVYDDPDAMIDAAEQAEETRSTNNP